MLITAAGGCGGSAGPDALQPTPAPLARAEPPPPIDMPPRMDEPVFRIERIEVRGIAGHDTPIVRDLVATDEEAEPLVIPAAATVVLHGTLFSRGAVGGPLRPRVEAIEIVDVDGRAVEPPAPPSSLLAADIEARHPGAAPSRPGVRSLARALGGTIDAVECEVVLRFRPNWAPRDHPAAAAVLRWSLAADAGRVRIEPRAELFVVLRVDPRPDPPGRSPLDPPE